MSPDRSQSRRTVLKLSAVAAVPAALAGCADEGPGEEEDPDDPAEEEANGDDEPETEEDEDEDEDDEAPADDEEENGDEDENEEDDAEDDENGNGEAIDPDTEIELDGLTQAWEGLAPDEIDGEENPTLVLEEGESYEITWVNGDGVQHNIEIRDDDGEIVDDYETDLMDEEGETQTLEVDEVTDEMAEYVCAPHAGTMVGEIEVE
ncbi:hypothetical protein GS429_16845 [Natronorubrum sp. JWXQ-INN-674]|uniref:Blue (type 1) copper domain-containing protein n=1 Tax=Natronorubrum halalkaliphilum TaxID=2691917 RepID=A0A6B0VRJ3_9EURY|nr:plastocyanin/azurin family copper-binding protein [Natronorubrum halalkaliphilum]MXV63697.1 hypothetical protein [Natronorubrum halalkaliphilum]